MASSDIAAMEVLKMLPLGLIYAVGELLTLRSVQKAGMSLLSMSKDTEFKTEDGYGWIHYDTLL
jgi:hypothetical protein